MIQSIPSTIVVALEKVFGKNLTDFHFAGGGCINQGGRITTGNGVYFLKWNDLRKYPGMFEAEAKGLALLASANSVRIPSLVEVGLAGDYQYLVIEYIEQATRKSSFWDNLGGALANLHRVCSPQFGLDHSNYIGSLSQSNSSTSDWIDFFVSQRLEPQLRIAEKKGVVEKSNRQKFDKLYQLLPTLLVLEKPSLLHGDLWSGNLIVDELGNPTLIDPAVYFGNREVDLAMTQLFGGFHDDFIKSYHSHFPLETGFRERFDIYNLYPLLVHTNLFGKSYWLQVVSILRQFV